MKYLVNCQKIVFNLRDRLVEKNQTAIAKHSQRVLAHLELIANFLDKFRCELGLQAWKVRKGQIFVDEPEIDFDQGCV